jgi:hypothetical protein
VSEGGYTAMHRPGPPRRDPVEWLIALVCLPLGLVVAGLADLATWLGERQRRRRRGCAYCNWTGRVYYYGDGPFAMPGALRVCSRCGGGATERRAGGS